MNQLDTREWLLTNGLGGFASGTVCDVKTRTYHGWLFAALEPPGQRTLLLSHLDASLEIAGQTVALSTHLWKSGTIDPEGHRLLQNFTVEPVPTWTWEQNPWQLSRRLLMPYGLIEPDQRHAVHRFSHRLLIQYRYHGQEPALLKLRPLIADRIFHHQQRAAPDLVFAQQVEATGVLLQAQRPDWLGTTWRLDWTAGQYQTDGLWYWGYRYLEETQRGLSDIEDLYSPGVLIVPLQPHQTVTLQAYVCDQEKPPSLQEADSFDQALAAEQQRLTQTYGWQSSEQSSGSNVQSLRRRLMAAGDQFLVYRVSTGGPTVIAGYPWFNDWGRDTLIALPGLTLTTQRFDVAKGLLRTFGQYCQQGLIPNTFPDADAKPLYNSLDAALWWIETLGLYLEASQDWNFLSEQYPIVWSIYKGLMVGTRYSIRVDAVDGLVTWDAPQLALTWMDALVETEPVTARRGKPVEINALWYSALCWAGQWAEKLQQQPGADTAMLNNQARRFATQAEAVKTALQKYWNPARGYLYDTISPDDYPDATIRPNAVIALSLRHCGFSETIGRQVLQVARQRLLTPYGLRSLDPADPQYVGCYRGGIWQRDRAYHQGTVWPWLLGSFIRAWQRFYPTEPIPFDWQPLLEHLQTQACLGSISEMFDGDPPHWPKGAIAQAWSVAEMLRHWQP